jgi:hypothetical protein
MCALCALLRLVQIVVLLPYFYFVFKVIYPLKTVNLFQALTVYSMLLAASAKETQQELPRAKWYKKNKAAPPTTGDILNQYKAASRADNMSISYKDFVKLEHIQRSRKNAANPSLSAVLYCRN